MHKIIDEIIDALFLDLSNRKGFDLGELDTETQDEIRDTWRKILEEILYPSVKDETIKWIL